MPYIQNAPAFIIKTLLGLYLIAVILRFLFQLFRVDFYNPICQTIVMLTNPPLRYLRDVIPALYGIDLAAIVLILIIGFVKNVLLQGLSGIPILPLVALVLAVAEAVNTICWILLIAIIGSAIVSWVAPYNKHPAIVLMQNLSEPVMAPLRRLLPNMGGLDISPIFAIIGIQLVQKLIVAPLNHYGFQLFG